MKAVLFDLGHTLIDYYHDWRGPETRAAANFGQAMLDIGAKGNIEEMQTFISGYLADLRMRKTKEMVEVPLAKVLGDILARYGLEEEEDLIKEGFEIFYDVLLEDRQLMPGTYEMLERLKEKDYAIGLVSDVAWGLPSEYPMRDLKFYGLDVFFDDFVFSTDVGLRKPHPRMFKLALYNLGVDASEAAFVGNYLQADIKGALGVGMKAILKASCCYDHDDSIIPSAKISSWDELDYILDYDP